MKTGHTVLAGNAVHTTGHTGAQQQFTCSLLLWGPDGVCLAGAGGAHDDHKARELLLEPSWHIKTNYANSNVKRKI